MAESKSAALPLGYAPPAMARTLATKPRCRNRAAADGSGGRHGFVDVLDIPLIGALEPLAQRRRRHPAECVDAADVEQLLRRPVRLVGGIGEVAAKADDFGDEGGEFLDADVAAAADIDMRFRRIMLHQENDRIGEIVDIEELAARLPGAPDLDRRRALLLGAVDLGDQRGDHMAVRRVEIVAWA